MNIDQPRILDLPLGNPGLTARHANMAALIVIMAVTILATL